MLTAEKMQATVNAGKDASLSSTQNVANMLGLIAIALAALNETLAAKERREG